MRYAKQFTHVLETGDASGLCRLTPDKRIHVMKAISHMAKFTGNYDKWQKIRQRYNLNWSTGTERLDVFTRFYDENNSLDSMIGWLKEAIQVLPKLYSDCFVFCSLTGLRVSEVIEVIRLLNSESITSNDYYNQERQCLEHFKYPQIFLRRTKAAYISIVDDEIIAIAKYIDKTPRTTA